MFFVVLLSLMKLSSCVLQVNNLMSTAINHANSKVDELLDQGQIVKVEFKASGVESLVQLSVSLQNDQKTTKLPMTIELDNSSLVYVAQHLWQSAFKSRYDQVVDEVDTADQDAH